MRNSYLGLGSLLLIIGLMVAPATVNAGAWTLDAGRTYMFVTETASRSENGFNGGGNQFSIPRYSKSELQALIEYGVTDSFTAMFAPSLQRVSIAAPFDAERSGLGYSDFGGRVRLLKVDSWVFSVQSIVRVPGTFDKTNPAAIGYYDTQVDVRGLVGYSFKAGTWPAFIDLQIAQRFRTGGPPDEFRVDFTFGIEPAERWLFLAQSFNVTSEGGGSWGYPSYGYYKLQLSAVYAVTPTVSLQLGGFSTYWGRNALQENGVVLGMWFKI
jgi:hypothetical protein